MTEKETVEQMLKLADFMIEKIAHRKDCKTACEILRRERAHIDLRIETGCLTNSTR